MSARYKVAVYVPENDADRVKEAGESLLFWCNIKIA